MIYCFIILASVALDRAVKYAVSSGMFPGESIPVIDGVFHITYIQNRGAAFSIMEGQWAFLIALPCAALIAGTALIILKRRKWHRLMLTAVALICGGGIGNLIDRVTKGYVVDMFDFRVFPVFNAADIFICTGCGLLLLYVLFFERSDRGERDK